MTEPGASTVAYTHGGVDWQIPTDLLDLQRNLDAADAQCTRLAEGEDQEAYDAARHHRLDLVLALYQHPWLLEQMTARRRHQADTALKHLARSDL